MPRRLPTFYISHGGGPWPWMPEMTPFYKQLEASLREIPSMLPEKPRTILMISAHWEAPEFRLGSNPQPPMIYDYGGFPEHTYQIHYRASGAPTIATEVRNMLQKAGIAAGLDSERGFDHGAFVPLHVMYPNAEIPVVTLSLKKGLDAEEHLKMGSVLTPLREKGILILGSGSSFHNLRSYFDPVKSVEHSKPFDEWLNRVVMIKDPGQRHAELLKWAQAPGAKNSHPREEHLIPLMVALGAAEDEPVTQIYHEEKFLVGAAMTSFRFGA